jgi:hypothetical protein
MAAGEYLIPLKDRRELILSFVPAPSEGANEGGAVVLVRSRSASPMRAMLHGAASVLTARRPIWGFAVAAAACAAVGWFAATARVRTEWARLRQAAMEGRAQVASDHAVAPQQKPSESVRPIPTFLLAAGIPSLRGTGNAPEPIVPFAPGDPLVMLELPGADPAHRRYRATLSTFADGRQLLSEDLSVRKETDAGAVVAFAVPSALVAGGVHYLVTLATLDPSGRATPVSRFLFKAAK